jgi:hypothetical protein
MRVKQAIAFPLIAFGIIVMLPVILPMVIAAVAMQDRRKRTAAASFHCLICGKVLGAASVRLSDDAFRREMGELRGTHPHVKFRVVRTCHAICPACGARYMFRDEGRTFAIEPSRQTGHERKSFNPHLH